MIMDKEYFVRGLILFLLGTFAFLGSECIAQIDGALLIIVIPFSLCAVIFGLNDMINSFLGEELKTKEEYFKKNCEVD